MFELIFKENLSVYGKHANILKKLSRDSQSNDPVYFRVSDFSEPIHIFSSMVTCFMVSAMVGLVNGKTAEVSHSGDKATIFLPELNSNRGSLERIYQHMVLATDIDLSPDERAQKAFSSEYQSLDPDAEREKIISYACGGLEILDDIFKDCNSAESVANALITLAQSIGLDEETNSEL